MREFQISDEDYRHAHFENLDDIIRRLDLPAGPQKIAVGSRAEFLPLAHYQLLVSKFGAESVIFAEELLQKIKYAKSAKELAIMQQANIVADAAFRGLLLD